MSQLLVMVEISFTDEEALKKATDMIQTSLRENKSASGFVVYEGKINFNLWFEGQADYSTLNQIKSDLAVQGHQDFSILAREFTETQKIKL